MDVRECFQLLTLASARDGRTVDKEVATVWASDLWDIPLEDATEAARDHYRKSTEWMMPRHVIEGVRIIRDRRDRTERVQRAIEGRTVPTGTCHVHAYYPIPCHRCAEEET